MNGSGSHRKSGDTGGGSVCLHRRNTSLFVVERLQRWQCAGLSWCRRAAACSEARTKLGVGEQISICGHSVDTGDHGFGSSPLHTVIGVVQASGDANFGHGAYLLVKLSKANGANNSHKFELLVRVIAVGVCDIELFQLVQDGAILFRQPFYLHI
mmetsp:Transcript_13542/g.31604  ORF Transcript_13542/g.31604 Transcript_13542/m.31604 type:complete len:155 (-) Transcript_13542:375-839(-)